MNQVNLLNRRLFATEVPSVNGILNIAFGLDKELEVSGLMEKIDEQIVIVWEDQKLYVGREVVGFDPAFKERIRDFEPIQLNRETFSHKSLDELEGLMRSSSMSRALISPTGTIQLDSLQ